MSETALVDVLGMLAGGVWISAAIYFQLIRERTVHPGYVSSLLLIGVALVLASSALAFAGRPSTFQLLGIVANGLFIVIGIGAWYALEIYAELEDAKCNLDDVDAADTH